MCYKKGEDKGKGSPVISYISPWRRGSGFTESVKVWEWEVLVRLLVLV